LRADRASDVPKAMDEIATARCGRRVIDRRRGDGRSQSADAATRADTIGTGSGVGL